MVNDHFDRHPAAPDAAQAFRLVCACIQSAMSPLAVNGHLGWHSEPGRRKRDDFCRPFDQFQTTRLVELDGFHSVIGNRLGLPANNVPGPKLMLHLGGIADADSELAFVLANDSLDPQGIPEVAVVPLIE